MSFSQQLFFKMQETGEESWQYIKLMAYFSLLLPNILHF